MVIEKILWRVLIEKNGAREMEIIARFLGISSHE